MTTKKKEIKVRLSLDEFNHLNELVKASHLSRESYLRMCISGLVPKPSPSTELITVIQTLRQIADSMNDIALKNVVADSVYQKNYELLQQQINAIMILIREPIPIQINIQNERR